MEPAYPWPTMLLLIARLSQLESLMLIGFRYRAEDAVLITQLTQLRNLKVTGFQFKSPGCRLRGQIRVVTISRTSLQLSHVLHQEFAAAMQLIGPLVSMLPALQNMPNNDKNPQPLVQELNLETITRWVPLHSLGDVLVAEFEVDIWHHLQDTIFLMSQLTSLHLWEVDLIQEACVRLPTADDIHTLTTLRQGSTAFEAKSCCFVWSVQDVACRKKPGFSLPGEVPEGSEGGGKGTETELLLPASLTCGSLPEVLLHA